MLQIRVLGSAFFGAICTLLVFYFMCSLITRADAHSSSSGTLPSITFSQVDIPDDRTKKQRPPPPDRPKPKETPPQPNREVTKTPPVITPPLQVEVPNIKGANTIASIPPTSVFHPENQQSGDLTRLVYVPPTYPPDAAIKGLEGWVRVEFTVRSDGSVSNPRVLESMPARIFDRDAIRAVTRWKFKPELRDGSPVERHVVQQIDFNLPKA